jgi:tripartite-type tricarboxylate transporter receptor subunit TctC
VPAEVTSVLNVAVNHALADPDLKAKALNLGIDTTGSTQKEMQDRFAADVLKWKNVIEKAGIPKE